MSSLQSSRRKKRTQRPTTASLSQQAYALIRHKIIALELAPGAVINESALREELGLGRTPIREALQRLALEKLIVIVPRRGTFVSDIGITDLNRLFEARLVLESFAARLASQRGKEEHWQRMDEILRGAELENVGQETLIAIDEACHNIMYEAADNKFLRDTLVSLYALSLRLWYYALFEIGGMHEAVLEHIHILEKLRARDADGAAQLLIDHIQTFQGTIQQVMLDMPRPGSSVRAL
ncbi:MAG: GntR family transcriptional regulator [Chloroflexi bacterium]|nr:GntR family transcriptional regulator [Chloroflexota bacterium]